MKDKNKAILLMLFSAFAFSASQIIVKTLVEIPLMEKVIFRNLIGLILSYVVLKKNSLSFWEKKENRKFLFYQSIFG